MRKSTAEDKRDAGLFGFDEMVYEAGLDKNSTLFTLSVGEGEYTFGDLILLSRVSQNARKQILLTRKGGDGAIRIDRCKTFR